LQYNRARYYAPALGTWISQDPLSFAANDTNLYRYVRNDSSNTTDSLGLTPLANSPDPFNNGYEYDDKKKDVYKPVSGEVVILDKDCSPGMTERGITKKTDKSGAVLTIDCVNGNYVGTIVGKNAGQGFKKQVGECPWYGGLNMIILGLNKDGEFVEIQWFTAEASGTTKDKHEEKKKKILAEFVALKGKAEKDPDKACAELRKWFWDNPNYLARDTKKKSKPYAAINYIWHRPAPDKLTTLQLKTTLGDVNTDWVNQSDLE
jgi:uncharacterized protein RhaS with RHS repeats